MRQYLRKTQNTVVKRRLLLIGIACVLGGSAWFYFQGYKDSGLIDNLSYFLTFIGWLILLFSCAGQILLKDKVKYRVNRSRWFAQSLARTAIYSIFSVLIVANLVFVANLGNKRIATILSTRPTRETTATVTEIENRNSRGGPRPYAIIKYDTETGSVEQSIFNYGNQYSVGQTYGLKYSIEYPEMFTITGQLCK